MATTIKDSDVVVRVYEAQTVSEPMLRAAPFLGDLHQGVFVPATRSLIYEPAHRRPRVAGERAKQRKVNHG